MSKKSCFRRPFDKQHRKRVKPLLNSASKHLYHIHWSLPSQMSWKKSLFSIFQVLGLLVITLAADEKYLVLIDTIERYQFRCNYLRNKKLLLNFLLNFLNLYQILKFLKWKICIFDAFLKSSLNFNYFEKQDDPHRFCNFEITDSENVVR